MTDEELQQWVAELCAATDVDPQLVPVAAVLDLARDAAHGVARPAAPLTTFLAGVLVARAVADLHSGPATTAAAVISEVSARLPAAPPG